MNSLGMTSLLLESSEDEILIIDAEGLLLHANSKFLSGKLTIARPVVGQSIRASLRPDLYQQLYDALGNTEKQPQKKKLVYTIQESQSEATYQGALIPYFKKGRVESYVVRLSLVNVPDYSLDTGHAANGNSGIVQPFVLVDLQGNVCDVNAKCPYVSGPNGCSDSGRAKYDITDLLNLIENLRSDSPMGRGTKLQRENRDNGNGTDLKCVIAKAAEVKDVIDDRNALAQRNKDLQYRIEEKTEDLKHLISQLRSKSEFLDNISSSIPGLIFLFNVHSGRVEFLRNNLGVNLGDVAQDKKINLETIRRFMHPDDYHSSGAEKWLDAPLRASIDYKFRIRLHDGSYRWFHLKTKSYSTSANSGGQERVIGVLFDIDHFMEAELKLKENERMLEQAQQVAKVGSWEWNILTGRLFWTDEIYRIFEQERDKFDCSYENFLKTVHPADRGMVEQAVENCLNHNATYNIVHRIQLSDARIKFVREMAFVKRDESGTPLKMIGTVQDVTDQVEADQKLNTAFTTIENSNSALFNADMSGNITYANPAAAKMWGFGTVAEMLKLKPCIADYWITDNEKTSAEILKVVHSLGQHPGTGYLQGKRHSGETFYALVNGSTMRNSDGETSGLIFSCFDVTEKIKIEEELEEQRDNYRSLYENALVGIFRTDIDTFKPVEVNDICARIFGYSSKEDFLQSFDVIGSYADPEIRTKMLRVMSETGTLENEEIRFRQKNGNVFWGQISVKLIKGTSIVEGVIVDVSERKQYEEKLRERVAEKELLLREIHHRVKNNLQIISGLLQLQLLKSSSSQCESALQDSKERIHAIALVHEKLYKSDNLTSINFTEYLRDLVLSILTMKSFIHVNVSYDTEDFGLTIEKAMPLGLICSELLMNSLKHAFNERHEGEITIALKKRENDVLLSVSDNGAGFDSGSLDKSTGIGWKLIASLVKQLKGHIEVEARTGIGTHTTIVFP